jgi:predicted urease superfamily metal-dependent hydrolase
MLDQICNNPMHTDCTWRKLLEIHHEKMDLRTSNAEFRSVLANADELDDTMSTKTRYLMALQYNLQDRMVTVKVLQKWTLSQVMARVAIVEETYTALS